MNTNGSNAPGLVVVTPIFEDVDASSMLFRELAATTRGTLFIVAVDDGSVECCPDVARIADAGLAGVMIHLKRNVGHQRAIAIGLNYVAAMIPSAQQVVVMDSDGEDIPRTIETLLQRLAPENIDVVVARRMRRVESMRFKLFYAAYKQLFRLLTGRKIGFGNFVALKPASLRRLVAMQELWIHFAGCVLVSRLRVADCALDRGPRYAGRSKMSFVGLALHGFRGLMVFAEDVLVRVGIACVFVAALAVSGVAAAILLKALGYATPGWFSIALGILLLVFLQTGAVTLMTLMLTGVVRGGAIAAVDWEAFIDRVAATRVEVKA